MTQGYFMIRVLFLFLLIGVSGSMYASRPKIAAAGEGSAFKKEWKKEKEEREKQKENQAILNVLAEEEKEEKKEKEEGLRCICGLSSVLMACDRDILFRIHQNFFFVKVKGGRKAKLKTTFSWLAQDSNLGADISFSFFRPHREYIELGTWTQKNKLKFDEIDLIFSKSFKTGNWRFKQFGGGLYLSSKRKSHLFNKKTKTRHLDEKASFIHNRGFGLLFGIECIRKFKWNFYAVSRLSCSLNHQHFQVRDRYRKSHYRREIFMPGIKMFLGIGWGEVTSFFGKKLDIRVGYKKERWFEQLFFSKKYMETQRGIFTLSGVTLSAKIGF